MGTLIDELRRRMDESQDMRDGDHDKQTVQIADQAVRVAIKCLFRAIPRLAFEKGVEIRLRSTNARKPGDRPFTAVKLERQPTILSSAALMLLASGQPIVFSFQQPITQTEANEIGTLIAEAWGASYSSHREDMTRLLITIRPSVS